MPEVTYINQAICKQDGKVNNKNVFSFLLPLIPRTKYWYDMGQFSGLDTSFALASVNAPGIYFIWSILGWPKISFGFFHKSLQKNPNKLFGQTNTSQVLPKVPQCKDGYLNQHRGNCFILLTHRVDSVSHLQITALRSFMNSTNLIILAF